MKKPLAVLYVTAFLLGGAVAHAQNNGKAVPIQTQSHLLDLQYDSCLKTPGCPVQERLEILSEMQSLLNEHLGVISQACQNLDYREGCVDPQQSEVQQWHKVHDNMLTMMQTLEAQSLGQKEPAAGDTAKSPAKSETGWWSRIWGK